MRLRWIALGVVGFAVWLIATFAVVYAAIELAGDDDQTQAIVIHRSTYHIGVIAGSGNSLTEYCVSYTIQGTDGSICDKSSEAPPDCYLDAEIGKRLPNSCQ